jgi:imidazolonepropionase-like amidohydrolase
MTEQSLPGELAYTQEETSAAADEARRHSLETVVHARSAAAVKMALHAGIRVLGHANYLDDEALDMLRERRADVFVTPAVSW